MPVCRRSDGISEGHIAGFGGREEPAAPYCHLRATPAVGSRQLPACCPPPVVQLGSAAAWLLLSRMDAVE